MKKIIITTTLALLTAGALTACQRGTADTFPFGGSDSPVNFAKDFPFDNAAPTSLPADTAQSYHLDVRPFSRLHVGDAIPVVFEQGTTCSVTVVTRPEYFDALDVSSDGTTLTLSWNGRGPRVRHNDPTSIHITAPTLSDLRIGVGSNVVLPSVVDVDDLTCRVGSGSNAAISDLHAEKLTLLTTVGSNVDVHAVCSGGFDAQLGSGTNSKIAVEAPDVVVENRTGSNLSLDAECKQARLTSNSGSRLTARIKADSLEVRSLTGGALTLTADCRKAFSLRTGSGTSGEAVVRGGDAELDILTGTSLTVDADCRKLNMSAGSGCEVKAKVKADTCRIAAQTGAYIDLDADCHTLNVDNGVGGQTTVRGTADKATLTGDGASTIDTSGLNH